MPTETLIVDDAARPWLAGRTLRALGSLGGAPATLVLPTDLPRRLAARAGPTWLLEAGAMVRGAGPRRSLPDGTIAVGAIHGSEGAPSLTASWARACASAPSALESLAPDERPRLASIHALDPGPLARHLAIGASLSEAVLAAARERSWRVVRDHRLDVTARPSSLVLVTVLTTLHRGGAERLVLDLHRAFSERSIAHTLVVLDRPVRATFPIPDGARLAYEGARGRGDRLAAACRVVDEVGADLVHAHLLDGDELEALARLGPPLITTLHNHEVAWPDGVARAASSLRLALACARSVAASWRRATSAPARVAFNGCPPQPARDEATRASERSELSLGDGALVLLAPANVRRQKRLDRLPALVAELARRGHDAHAVLAGEVLSSSDDGASADRALVEATEREGVAHRIHRVGSRLDLAPLRAAADVHVAPSEWEGLSVAQLESIGAGLAVVATDVDGARDIAAAHRGMELVRRDAPASVWADAVERAARTSPSPLAPSFSIGACAARHAALYAHATRVPLVRSETVVFVTNHLFTGGAQSSLRRLIAGMRARAVDARLALLEEHEDDASPGRRALEALGAPVTVAPHAAHHDPWRGACHVLAYARAVGARALVFWNAIAEHKALIADGAIDHRVFDVSPGEMWFASLARYLERPRVELPIATSRDYGALLDGVVVKYERERGRAELALGKPVHVIANGVPLPPEPLERAPRATLVLGTLARIGADKKLEQLLDALALAHPRLPPYEMRIGGATEPGEERYAEALRARHPQLPIRWEGEVESRSLLQALDVLALVAEPAGCPNASLEAMAQALPVVATDAGGMNEQVLDGVTGRLVPRGDVTALAEALESVCRASAPARATMGRAGRARVAAQFSLDRMVEGYASLLGISLGPRC